MSVRGLACRLSLLGRSSSAWKCLAALILSEVLYAGLLRLDASNGLVPLLWFWTAMALLFLLYAAASRWLVQISERHALRLALAGTILFRLTLLPAGLPHNLPPHEIPAALSADLRGHAVTYERFLLFDSDVWRYLWEGRVAAHGFDPFVLPPHSAALNSLAEDDSWQQIRDRVNHPNQPSIYPPLAQVAFRASYALAPGSVLAWKALVALADVGVVALLAFTLRRLGRRGSEASLYGWNPLVLKVFAGSGHVDAFAVLGIAMLCWAVTARSAAGTVAGLSGAILAKIFPVAIVPLVVKRSGWRIGAGLMAVLTSVLLWQPDSSRAMFVSLVSFGRTWRFNEGIFRLLEWMLGATGARVMAALGLAALAAWLVRRMEPTHEAVFHAAAILLGGVLLASPVVMPWYLPAVLPLSVLARQHVWIWFSAIVLLAFHVMISQRESLWLVSLEYLLLLVAFFWEGARRSAARGFHDDGESSHITAVVGLNDGTLGSGERVHGSATARR
jgi:alpha-1,6-mannosyltransferase